MKNLWFLSLFFIFSIVTTFAQTNDTISYRSIYYKGSAWVSKDDQYRHCQFNLINVIDSFLYIQVNVAGIEIGRALANPDKILLINKFEKNYYDGDYTALQILLGIDFDFNTLQAIFNGIPVSVPENVEISYQGVSTFDEHSFFKILTCESFNYGYKLELEIKKITFDDVPAVSVTVPKNFTPIIF